MSVKLAKRIFAIFTIIISVITSIFTGTNAITFTARDEENIRLNFAAISDTHLQEGCFRNYALGLALDDLGNACTPVDAVVISGDLTDHGYDEQWDNLVDCFEKYNTVENVILSAGNHDTWVDSDLPEDYIAAFCKAVNEITDLGIDKPYYTTDVNGYTFIVLGSEGTLSEKMVISDEQLAWLDASMAEATADGKPVFVVCHNTLNGTHGLPGTWGDDEPQFDDGGIGDSSEAVETILKSYENVFFITGHIHIGICDEKLEPIYGYTSIETEGSFHSINLPCYMYVNPTGIVTSGMGFQFEVYDEEVILRARDYETGLWYTDYEYNIPIV